MEIVRFYIDHQVITVTRIVCWSPGFIFRCRGGVGILVAFVCAVGTTTDLPVVVNGTFAVIMLGASDIVHLATPSVGAIRTMKLWHPGW
jgi:hypothetical protein